MEKNKTVVCWTADEGTRRELTVEELHEGEEHLLHDFAQLLQLLPHDNVRWTGTQTDLMELIYMAYLRGIARDAEGYPASLKSLTHHTCKRLHAPVPSNPSSVGRHAISRKGVRRNTLLQRYTWYYKRKGQLHPLEKETTSLTSRKVY